MRTAAEVRELLKELKTHAPGKHHAVYGHRWELNSPAKESDVEAFKGQIFKALRVAFDPERAEGWSENQEPEDWKAHRDAMAGSMPIATLGCGDWYCLVISGPHAGEIWFDNRGGDGMPPDPVVDDEGELSFRAWYEAWLDECEQRWLK